MAISRTKWLVVACVVAATISAVASPVFSREGVCPPFDPVEPNSESEQTNEALKARVLKIEDGAVNGHPVVADFEVGPNLWVPGGGPLVEDTKFFNLQVLSESSREVMLHTRLMWDSSRQLADLDLFIYDARGKEIERSDRPMGQPRSKELVSVPARRCEGFTVEVRALRTLEASGTIQVWLSRGQ